MNIMDRLNFNYLNVVCLSMFVIILYSDCSTIPSKWENMNEEGTFLIFRRQSMIGEEEYKITSGKDSILVTSLQGENERGRISGVLATLHLGMDFSPLHYENIRLANDDTTNVFKMEIDSDKVNILEKNRPVITTEVPSSFFPLHSNIPAAMEMMLYHYYFKNKKSSLTTLPRGELSVIHRGVDTIELNGNPEILDRYVVEGINWGGRTIWLDASKNLVAVVKANTQIREIVRKGYEHALQTFIDGNVIEQMRQLNDYTKNHKQEKVQITALVGGNVVSGLTDQAEKDVTLIIEDGRIKSMGPRDQIEIPKNSKVIDVSGKTLIPGLWDMHAHSNQVQWAPAYLAAGITTIRDNGNEIEFATAFRDAIDLRGAMGPDILLAGMTDGPGAKGNGIIRATSPEEARDVVAMYHKKGYNQIKIYTSIEPNILKVLAEEAHKKGITTTGHVPRAVGNTIEAVESGLDQLSHRSLFLSALFPDQTLTDLGRYYLIENELSKEQITTATNFFLKHKTVLDPTIALDIVRSVPKGVPIETVEPDAGRIAYELFEGKRFRSGVSSKRSEEIKEDIRIGMKIIGDFFRAGIPVVAGTDNVVPVFSLYLEIESYHKLGGLTPLEAIQTATIIPARAMGLESKTGTLEIGKEADIAILEKNPLSDIDNIRTVTAVLSNGNYYDSEPLWLAADFKPSND